jgi:hypothetical protein
MPFAWLGRAEKPTRTSATSPDPVCPEGNQMPVNPRHRTFLKELDFTGRLHTIKAVMVATLGR